MKTILIYIIGCLIAYCLGSISPSLLFSKMKKTDLRKDGSGNLGASNTTLLLGWKFGVLVGLIDILKGTIPVLLARFIFPGLPYLPFVVALCAVLGHIFPFYLKGKGGKGFATYMGIILGLDWRFFIIIGVTVIIVTLVTDYIVLGTFSAISTFPIWLIFMSGVKWGFLIVLPLSIIIFVKHIENIGRMIRKEEKGISHTFKKKKNE